MNQFAQIFENLVEITRHQGMYDGSTENLEALCRLLEQQSVELAVNVDVLSTVLAHATSGDRLDVDDACSAAWTITNLSKLLTAVVELRNDVACCRSVRARAGAP